MCSTIHCKKNLPGVGVGVGDWWGKCHCCNAPWGGGGGGGGGGGKGHWSMDNSPTPPQVGGGGGGLIIDRCISQ